MNGFGRIARKLILLIMTVVMLYLSFTSMFTTVYVTDAEHIFFCGDHTVYILLTIFALVILLVIFRIKKIGILKDQTLRAAVWMLFFLLIAIASSSLLKPILDQRHVSEVAGQILHYDYSSFLKGEYARTFDNQHGIILFLSLIYRFFGEGNILAVQLINAACMAGFVVIWNRFLKRICTDQADAACILICSFVPFWGYVTFVYGTIPYLLLSAVALFCGYMFIHSDGPGFFTGLICSWHRIRYNDQDECADLFPGDAFICRSIHAGIYEGCQDSSKMPSVFACHAYYIPYIFFRNESIYAASYRNGGAFRFTENCTYSDGIA